MGKIDVLSLVLTKLDTELALAQPQLVVSFVKIKKISRCALTIKLVSLYKPAIHSFTADFHLPH